MSCVIFTMVLPAMMKHTSAQRFICLISLESFLMDQKVKVTVNGGKHELSKVILLTAKGAKSITSPNNIVSDNNTVVSDNVKDPIVIAHPEEGKYIALVMPPGKLKGNQKIVFLSKFVLKGLKAQLTPITTPQQTKPYFNNQNDNRQSPYRGEKPHHAFARTPNGSYNNR